MPKEVQDFVHDFLKAELSARNAYIKPDRKLAYKHLEITNSFCHEELHYAFGMIKADRQQSAGYFKKMQKVVYESPRDIYKISHYKNRKYGDLFLVLVSNFNPSEFFKIIGECFFVASVKGDWQIVRIFGFDEDEISSPWFPFKGDRDISFASAGKLLEIYRFFPPEHDEASMKAYKSEA